MDDDKLYSEEQQGPELYDGTPINTKKSNNSDSVGTRINNILNSPRPNPYAFQQRNNISNNNDNNKLGEPGTANNSSKANNEPSKSTHNNKPSNLNATNNSNLKAGANDAKNKIKQKGVQAALGALGVPPKASEALMKYAQNRRSRGSAGALGALNNFGLGSKKNTSGNKSTEVEGVIQGEVNNLVKPVLGILAGLTIVSFVFVGLFAASQTYLNAMKLHQSYNSEKIESFINNKMTDEQKEKEITDEDVNDLDETGFYDYSKSNFVTIAKTEDFDIRELDDYYSYVEKYDDIDESIVYNFFFKLDFIEKYYKNNYRVNLDIPLIMSTLILQSEDMKVVFEANTKGFDYKKCREKVDGGYNYSKCYTDEFSYAKNYFRYDSDKLNNYKIRFKKSEHDIEILAKNMVSKVNDTSYTLDLEKYEEFLEEFLEKKYFLDKDSDYDDGTDSDSVFSIAANFTKYTFEGDLLEQIASVCYREQGSAKGAAAEASLIANRFEYYGESYQNKYGKTGEGLYHYLLESKWWGNPSSTMSAKSAPDEVVAAVRTVLVEGKRTLPRYVDEHDCWDCNSTGCSDGKRGDICSINTNGSTKTSMSDIKTRSNYQMNETIIKNIYGADYTFFTFPTDYSDPFGYLSEKYRQTVGDCYYDFDTGNPVNCGTAFVDNFLQWLISIANDDSHGYSQTHRSSLVDFDCSSFVYYGLINSGFNTEQLGKSPFTTRTQRDVLNKNGFTELKFSDLVPDGKTTTNLEPGDILWTTGHTEVYVGEGMSVAATQSETLGITGEYGDQTGKEIYVRSFWNDNWQYVYRYGG